MRIALICQYFAPEPGAPQARLLETARTWASEGHRVTVLTGFPNHPTGVLAREDRGRLFREDRRDGLRILRSWLYATPNRGFLRKIMSHLSFMASSVLIGGPRARRPDVIVVSSPTFFSVFSAWLLSRLWRCPFVFEVRDLWPAIFTQLGVIRNPRIIRLLEGWEMWLYRRAARVVPVTEGFRRDITGRGIDAAKVVTITNGVDTGFFRPSADREADRRALGLEGGRNVLYLGAHGISHALARILDVAARFADRPDVLFLFVGEGAEKPALVESARARGLGNVRFLPPVDKGEVPRWYGAADVCLVPLRDVPLFDTFIPSKIFEILGAGRPIVSSVAGESAEILERSGGAIVVPPEDVDAIEGALRRVLDDEEERRRMEGAGPAFVRRHYDRAMLARRYLSLLGEVVREARTGGRA